jgi:hypothetical protein
MAEAGISADRTRQHEALVLRLEVLLADVRRLAARAPAGAVSAPLRAAAEGLLYDAQKFRLRGRREALPVAAPSLGELAVELGQARARLEAFELIHSSWSGKHKAFVWRTPREPRPVTRLRPALPEDERLNRREGEQMRKELLRRLKVRVEEAYEQGYADARTGKPPPPEMP